MGHFSALTDQLLDPGSFSPSAYRVTITSNVILVEGESNIAMDGYEWYWVRVWGSEDVGFLKERHN